MNITTLIVAEGHCPDIQLTLSSVSEVASEIILVDIGLDHSTRAQIMSERPDVVFKQLARPEYVELIRQQTFAYASHEWILLLDPDEYLSPELIKYVKGLTDDAELTHYKIPRQNYIFGKWISHSRWWPDYQIRLFRKSQIEWPTSLHGQPKLEGKGMIIGAFEDQKLEMHACAIVHHNYTNVLQYLEKALRYAHVDAQMYIDEGKSYTIVDAARRGTGEFISRFFADKGYKDGVHGLVLALLQMYYYILVYTFVWEKQGYQEATQTQVLRAVKQLFITTSKEIYYWLSREHLARGTERLIARAKSRLM